MPQFAWGFPTMVSYPPPVPPPLPQAGDDTLVMPNRPRINVPPPTPYRPRSRAWRLLHDCLCLPDFHVMKDFYDARRRVEEIEVGRTMRSRRARHHHHTPARGTDNPIAIGLLLTLVPPLGVTLLWASRRFSRAAKIGITAYAAAVSIAVAALVIAAVVG